MDHRSLFRPGADGDVAWGHHGPHLQVRDFLNPRGLLLEEVENTVRDSSGAEEPSLFGQVVRFNEPQHLLENLSS